MKILLLENPSEIKVDYLDYLLKNNELIKFGEEYNADEIDTIVIRSKVVVDSDLLDKFKNLKFVARVGVGLDKVDLEECNKRGIEVLNTPGVNADSVADLVLAGVLNLTRNLSKGFLGIERRFEYMGNQLNQESVGIIGFGNIGRKIYNRFKAFGVTKFYIFDPFLKKEDVEKNEFCKFVEEKKNIFIKSDIISFHIPLLPQTKNFLGEDEFKLLKKEVILVNTSRGGIIDEKILINFLKENENSRFFADVWEEENELKNPKKELLNLENSLITPHIGAMTKHAEKQMHYFEKLK